MAESKNTKNNTRKTTTSSSTGRSKSSGAARSHSKKALEEQRLREEALRKSRARRRAASVILLALGAFVTLAAIIPGTSGWRTIFDVMHGLFGIAAYVFGPFLVASAVMVSSERPKSRIVSVILSLAAVQIVLCAAFEIFMWNGEFADDLGGVISDLYIHGMNFAGGGFFALFIGEPLLLLGRTGAIIAIIIIMLVCVLLFIKIPVNELFGKIGKGAKSAGHKTADKIRTAREESAIANEEYRRIREEKNAQKALAREEKKRLERERMEKAAADERKYFDERLEKQRRRDNLKNIVSDVSSGEEQNFAKNEENSVKLLTESTDSLVDEQHEDSRDYREAIRKYMQKKHPILRAPEPPDPDKFVDSDADLVPIADAIDKLNAQKTPSRGSKTVKISEAPKITEKPRQKPSAESIFDDISDIEEAELAFDINDIEKPKPVETPELITKNPRQNILKPVEEIKQEPKATVKQPNLYETYTLPPMNLLNEAKKPVKPADIEIEIRSNADKLVNTLKSFGVTATFMGASRGPSVTRYELQPAPGVKISKISGLSDDLALNLAVSGIRIAPVPDKAAVGIEIPNKIKDTVYFRELVDTESFKKSFSKKLESVLGKNISGESVTCNVSKMPHLLIAGTTGSGKSVCVNSIIMSILMKSTPSDVRLIMVDPKQVEFMMYNGIPHLLIPVVTDPKKAAGALAWSVTEMENRYTLFSENNVRNIDGYNELVEKGIIDGEKMPSIVIFIDELADLMMASPKDVEDSIVRLAQKARAAGMHLVIATQKPTVQVVTGLIKGNIPSRIALMVASQIDSRVILDASGAEKLLGNGDMLYMPVGSPKPIRLQGCYVSDDEVERVVDFIKQTFTAVYDENIIAEIERNAENVAGADKSAPPADEPDGEEDEKLEDAIDFVVSAGQASTSALQRHLKLGYGRAARLIDTMEKMGIVGPFEGSKPRQVLITRQEWYERKLRT